MIEFAVRYAEAGYKVFPVKPRGKIPLTEHGSHDATVDQEIIASWWAKWPDANIGMTLDDLVVVDIDPRNGGEVEALPGKLPDTCYAQTGGGGWHYLYRSTAEKYRAHPAQGVDVKSGPGAYIVVEPSIHKSGQKYVWLDETEPWAMPPNAPPDWLAEVQEKPTPINKEGGIASGRRNETLTAMAGAMRRRGMSARSIEAALQVENLRCNPPLEQREINTIANSVGRYTPEEKDPVIPLVVSPVALRESLLEVYRNGLGRGDGTGWPSIDELLSIAPGQLTTITGYPNSGKSQWLDALALRLGKQGWHFVFCSLENIPIYLHIEKLAMQWAGKPLREGPSRRMSETELSQAIDALSQWARFVSPTEQRPNPSLEEIIQCAQVEFQRQGIWEDSKAKKAVVIDPWNELEHMRPRDMSLTEHIGQSLSFLRQWARQRLIHVFIVGHPAKQYRNRESARLPVATPDMISDSSHFWNKSDICITVALTDEHRSAEVDIHVQKMRFAHIGKRGMATLRFDRLTGQYHESLKAVEGYAKRYDEA